MNSRALNLAIQLLVAAGGGLAVGTLVGCPFVLGCGDDTGWREPQPIALGVDVDLQAVVRLHESEGERYWTHLAVGAGGTVVAWGETIGETVEPFVDRFVVGGSVLRGVAVDETGWWVVGDGGTLAVSQNRGQSWSIIVLGIDADFHAIASHADKLVVAGDNIVVAQDTSGNWVEVDPPNDGWGQLRGLYGDGTRIHAVGLAGVVWSATDPLGPWTLEPVGVDVDLFAVGAHSTDTRQVLIVGAQGTVMFGDRDAGWTTVETNTNVDFIDCSESTWLSVDGVVTELRPEGDLVSVGTFPGARALWHEPYTDLVTVGEGGAAMHVEDYECVGGRPFTIDGRPRTAQLRREGPSGGGEASDKLVTDVSGDRLAAAWAGAGLYEHASVASFARFALELLALGAPPELLRAVSRASLDELEHARLCFELAHRFAGIAVGPGPLPIPAEVLARRGDPVETAVALLEEGCVNESVAACEAADAAERCVDPHVRRVLELLAEDERRHAAAAWAALRWLIERHGERVAAAVRARMCRLGAIGGLEATRVISEARADGELADFGVLPPRRRAHVRQRVLREVVRPLASSILPG